MVFKRRDKLHWVESLRSYVLPRRGWRRVFSYIGHRLKRLPDSPDKISRGLAYGVFTSWSPWFGFHIIFAMLMGKFMRGNVFAAAVGTFFGNPFTFPFIIAFSLRLGNWLLGRDLNEHDIRNVGRAFRDASKVVWESIKSIFGYGHNELAGLADFFSEVVLPYFIGGSLLGLVFSIASFFLTRPLIRAYQAIRRKKVIEKARKSQLGADK